MLASERTKSRNSSLSCDSSRDGNQVFATMPAALGGDKPPNPKIVISIGSLQPAKVPPGDYILQILLVDKLQKGKDGIATQAIDFQVR